MHLFADMVVDLYNKKKIQMIFFVEYGFYFTREVKNMYISFVASPLMNLNIFHFTRLNKSHIQQKHLNILYVFKYEIL